MSTEQGDELLE